MCVCVFVQVYAWVENDSNACSHLHLLTLFVWFWVVYFLFAVDTEIILDQLPAEKFTYTRVVIL